MPLATRKEIEALEDTLGAQAELATLEGCLADEQDDIRRRFRQPVSSPEAQLYLVTITNCGAEMVPAYEHNTAMVVCATEFAEARRYASQAVIDEDADIWLDERFSTIKLIGTAHQDMPLGIIVRENNAS